MQVIALEEVDGGRPERAKVLALARAPKIDAILVTEVSRWGRSTQDLVQTLDDLHGWKVSVLAQTGLSFDLSTTAHLRHKRRVGEIVDATRRQLSLNS
jgi:DNA invertase Pin-like site-specific DNA recombinase